MTSAGERTPFAGLQLGALLGRGSYGRVYKGYYHGRVIAVKARLLGFSRFLTKSHLTRAAGHGRGIAVKARL